MSKKKVGIIVPSLSKAGAEKVAANLSILLDDKYEIYYILFKNNVTYDHIGETIVLSQPKYFGKFGKYLSYLHQIKSIKRNKRLDYSISFLEGPNILNILSKTAKSKTILSIRNYISLEYSNYKGGKFLEFFVRKFYNKADSIVVVSDLIEKEMIETYSIKPEKITRIYNPIDLKTVEAKSNSDKLDKSILDWIGNSVLFINVGRLEFQKNQEMFIDVLYELRKLGSDVKGIILGEGSKRRQLENQIRLRAMDENVLLLGHKDNPYPFLKRADIYFLTSFFEGFPNALIEAMASKNYIISVDCKSGPSEILGNPKIGVIGKSGLLIPDAYKEALSKETIDVIKKVVDSESERTEGIENCLLSINRYSYLEIANQWTNLISSL